MSVLNPTYRGVDAPNSYFDHSQIFDEPNYAPERNEHNDRVEYVNSCIGDHFKALFDKLKLVTKVTKEQDVFDAALNKKIEGLKIEIYHAKAIFDDFIENLDTYSVNQLYDELELPF